MSNKAKIWDADKAIRTACPVGMEQGVKLTIEYFCGFELFNTRPYHNYETWSSGYRVSGPVGPIGYEHFDTQQVTTEAEDLDDAIARWIEARNKITQKENK